MTISDDDNILHIEGYNLIRPDHPDNIKRGGICLLQKGFSFLRKIELSYITECLLCEVIVKGQVDFIIVSYHSQSQTSFQFVIFYQILRNSLMMFRSFNQPLKSFTDQPSLVVDIGVHLTLHENFHHQITYCKLNLKDTINPLELFVEKCQFFNQNSQ